MFHTLHPEFQLAEVRERHNRMRRDAEHSRLYRESKQKHRFRSRQRRP
jgi:hypothetical protein